MTNNQIMKKRLELNVIGPLCAQGFTGKYPHFRRVKEGFNELISFQTNKLVQRFNEDTAEMICKVVNKQLVNAFKWLRKFEKCNL